MYFVERQDVNNLEAYMNKFKGLKVWEDSTDLAVEVYNLTYRIQ